MKEQTQYFLSGFLIAAVLGVIGIAVVAMNPSGVADSQESVDPGTLSVIFNVDAQNEIRYDIAIPSDDENYTAWKENIGEELTGNDITSLDKVLEPYASEGAVATLINLNENFLGGMEANGIPLNASISDVLGTQNLVGMGFWRKLKKVARAAVTHCTASTGKTKSFHCTVRLK